MTSPAQRRHDLFAALIGCGAFVVVFVAVVFIGIPVSIWLLTGSQRLAFGRGYEIGVMATDTFLLVTGITLALLIIGRVAIVAGRRLL